MGAVQFENFVSALMKPLPASDLVDVGYGKTLRALRKEAWIKASTVTEFWSLALDFRRSACRYRRRVGDLPIDLAFKLSDDELLAELRKATAAQILTPADTQLALAWKRRAIKMPCLPVRAADLTAAIATDEAFFAAHPVRKRKPARV